MNAEDRCFCELAPLYALDLLDDDDRRWVEAQAIDNPDLAAELADHQQTVDVLPYALPVAPLATDLKERLFQRLAQEPAPIAMPALPLPAVPPSRRSSPVPAATPTASTAQGANRRVTPNRRHIWLQAAGTIAALVAIALLIDNYRLRQNVQASRAIIQASRAIVDTLQQPDSIVYTLRGTENAANASGSLIVNAGEKTAVVLVQNLPTLPAGQAYRLWAVAKGATKPTYCGQFNSNPAGTVRWSLPETVCSASVPQMLMTAESTAAPFVPQGSLVMKSVL